MGQGRFENEIKRLARCQAAHTVCIHNESHCSHYSIKIFTPAYHVFLILEWKWISTLLILNTGDQFKWRKQTLAQDNLIRQTLWPTLTGLSSFSTASMMSSIAGSRLGRRPLFHWNSRSSSIMSTGSPGQTVGWTERVGKQSTWLVLLHCSIHFSSRHDGMIIKGRVLA